MSRCNIPHKWVEPIDRDTFYCPRCGLEVSKRLMMLALDIGRGCPRGEISTVPFDQRTIYDLRKT
jgi:hypothetical protein